MTLADEINRNYERMRREEMRAIAQAVREHDGRDAAEPETPAEFAARIAEIREQTAAIVKGQKEQEQRLS